MRPVGVSNIGVIAALSDNTLNNYNECFMNTATAFKFSGVAATVTQWDLIASNAYTPASFAKAAWSYATNNILSDFNGTAQTADVSATVPTVTQLDVGNEGGSFQLNGAVRNVRIYARQLSQSALATLDR